MRGSERTWLLIAVAVSAMALCQVVAENGVHARAGSGRSGGYRGSRSYRAPERVSPPSRGNEPIREPNPASQPAAPVGPQSGGFMRGIAGGLLGGFLGSLLFSGFGHAGLGGGFGLIEILLLVSLGYFFYRRFRRSALATDYAPMQYENSATDAPEIETRPEPLSFQEPDFSSIRIMDRDFDPRLFLSSAQNIFFKVQAAWSKRDAAALSALCGPELMRIWEEELAALRARGQFNRMENIALRSSDITEVWTESGQDYITVRFQANLLDYTIDERGALVEGSNSEAINFEEFWTFTRSVGPNQWKLTAVQQP